MQKPQPHIQLSESIHAKYALLPGDPARLDRIIPFLENVQEQTFSREYRSLTGEYKGVRILAMSTGMGGVSTGIAVEELSRIGISAMIRIGSCGALQPKVSVGDLIIVNGAVRDDGASQTYIDPTFPAVPDTGLMLACIQAAQENSMPFHVGIARSHDSFYTDINEEINTYWSAQGVLGSDMETAALFTIGHLRGIKTASILNNVVPFEVDPLEGIGSYAEGENIAMQGEKNEILAALEAFVKLENL